MDLGRNRPTRRFAVVRLYNAKVSKKVPVITNIYFSFIRIESHKVYQPEPQTLLADRHNIAEMQRRAELELPLFGDDDD